MVIVVQDLCAVLEFRKFSNRAYSKNLIRFRFVRSLKLLGCSEVEFPWSACLLVKNLRFQLPAEKNIRKE